MKTLGEEVLDVKREDQGQGLESMSSLLIHLFKNMCQQAWWPICHPCIPEAEAGGLRVQDQAGLRVRLCLKIKTTCQVCRALFHVTGICGQLSNDLKDVHVRPLGPVSVTFYGQKEDFAGEVT
jgi:hypothetical protein